MRLRGSFISHQLDIGPQIRDSRELHKPLIMRAFRFLDIFWGTKKAPFGRNNCRIRGR